MDWISLSWIMDSIARRAPAPAEVDVGHVVGKQRDDVVEREPVEGHVLLRVPAVLRGVADVSDYGGVALGDRLGNRSVHNF